MTQTQKEQDKNHILNNIDKFIIDSRGDFVNLEKDYRDSDYIIWKGNIENYEELREKVIWEVIKDKKKLKLTVATNKEFAENLMEIIWLEKDKWKIVYETNLTWWFGIGDRKPIFYRYCPTGEEVSAIPNDIFNSKQIYILNGELGMREGIWKDYIKQGSHKVREWWGSRKWKKHQRENQANNNFPLPMNNPEIPTNPSPQQPEKSQSEEEEKLRTEENKKYEEAKEQAKNSSKNPLFPKNTSEDKKSNNPNQITPSPNQDKPTNNNTLSNPLPSSTDIQNQYNSDKDKSEINNNPTLTNNSQEKEQAQEFLKVIISAELLVKETKFNSEILSKLLTEKKQNISLYQMLNKEGRVDKAISQLESIQQSQEKNKKNPTVNPSPQKNKNSFPAEIILIFLTFLIVGIGIVVFWKRRKGKKG